MVVGKIEEPGEKLTAGKVTSLSRTIAALIYVNRRVVFHFVRYFLIQIISFDHCCIGVDFY